MSVLNAAASAAASAAVAALWCESFCAFTQQQRAGVHRSYAKTASAQAFDSTQMFGVLCPEQMQAHENRRGGAKAKAQKATGIAARLIDAPARASARDTLMIGSRQERWNGLASRQGKQQQQQPNPVCLSACPLACSAFSLRHRATRTCVSNTHSHSSVAVAVAVAVMLMLQHPTTSYLYVCTEMLKTRRQEKEASARKWANDYCATFPEPGCVKQHVQVEGPPGVRPSGHHRSVRAASYCSCILSRGICILAWGL